MLFDNNDGISEIIYKLAKNLKYINTFRKVYLDTEAPFKLTYPDGFDEFLDISEEEDDDGF